MRWITDTLARYGLECFVALLYGGTVSGLIYSLWGYVAKLPVYTQISGGVFVGATVFFVITYLPWWWRNRKDIQLFFDEQTDQAMNPLAYSGERVRYFRIGIQNKSHKDIHNCQVELSDIVDADGDRPLQVPKFLEYQLQPGANSQTPLIIPSTRRIYANLVSLEEETDNNDILLRCASPLMPILVPRNKSYFLLVSVFALGGVGDSKWFHVFIDQEGHLRCWNASKPRFMR